MITIQLPVQDAEDAKTMMDLARILNPDLSAESLDVLTSLQSIENVLGTLLDRYMDDLGEEQFREILEALEILDRIIEVENLGLATEK